MAKTAYLYDFAVMTRVVANPDDFKSEKELYEYLTQKAREQILAEPQDYLCGDNGNYIEDEECPYGTFEEED